MAVYDFYFMVNQSQSEPNTKCSARYRNEAFPSKMAITLDTIYIVMAIFNSNAGEQISGP